MKRLRIELKGLLNIKPDLLPKMTSTRVAKLSINKTIITREEYYQSDEF